MSNPRQGVFDKPQAREWGLRLPPGEGGQNQTKGTQCQVVFSTSRKHTRLVPSVALARVIGLRCIPSQVPGKIRPFRTRGAGAPTPGAPPPAQSEPPPSGGVCYPPPTHPGIATLSDKSPPPKSRQPFGLVPPVSGGSVRESSSRSLEVKPHAEGSAEVVPTS